MENLNNDFIQFDLPKDQTSIIKVIGVGGGGCNAVNHMYNKGILGVDFMICNTDNQSLELSPVPTKIQLGKSLTEGRGAGAKPEVGLKSALESLEEIKSILEVNTKMVFITAGMGGGTGTGAAPVIAKLAKDMGILTVGIVTLPFGFEGKKRREQADQGLKELKNYVDTLIVISNDKLRELYSNMSLTNAFGKADDVLATAAKGISEIITHKGYINVDFEDVKTVMTNGGSAIMGASITEGENRAIRAIEEAMGSPLLNDNDLKGAKNILLYISSGGEEVTMDEVGEITDYVYDIADTDVQVIWGCGRDTSLGNCISVTLIATGFNSFEKNNLSFSENKTNVTLDVENKSSSQIIEAINLEKFNTIIEPVKDENDFFASPDEVKFELNDSNEISFEVNEVKKEDSFDRINLFDELNEENKNSSIDKMDLFTDFTPEVSTPTALDINNVDKSVLFKTNDRHKRLQELSRKIKTPSGLKEMENKPAYERNGLKLDENSIDDSIASNSSIGFDKDDGYKLKENNSFLHGSVD